MRAEAIQGDARLTARRRRESNPPARAGPARESRSRSRHRHAPACMNPKEPLLPRVLARLRMMRYRWFGRAPTLEEWESRLERVVSETVAQSLRWIPEHGGSFVDVGANVGIYAERVLRDRPDARAWLFEPVRAHYERCRDRFRGNPNVVVTTPWSWKSFPTRHPVKHRVWLDRRSG